jgi:hypothetical protein
MRTADPSLGYDLLESAQNKPGNPFQFHRWFTRRPGACEFDFQSLTETDLSFRLPVKTILPVVLGRLLKSCSKNPEVILQNAGNGGESQSVTCRHALERRTTKEGIRNLMWTVELFTSWLCPGPPFHGPPPRLGFPFGETRKLHRT